ncbi:MAG: DNA repair protein [Bacilli bacterium]|nr:DNA repair protein [Bacilli bacterium]
MATYLCIDLKSFYASVECVLRGLDPLKTNLVVADPSRGNGAICLAITPPMKKLGIKNRCRIFEIPKGVNYITALPRMKKYMEISAMIYGIYLKYVSKDDIHVYSIDECFLDVTKYLSLYQMDAYSLSKKIIDDVYNTTHITATAGIGTNLFLAKVALDITAKHAKDNIGYLNEELFKENLWHHTPITDIWNISRGIATRLAKYGIYDLYGITQIDEAILYKEFGVNALFLIDHAYGIEPCTIEEIHNYKSKSNSLSHSQILFEDYKYDDALLVLKEMVDLLVLEIVEKGLAAKSVGLGIGYSKDVIKGTGGSAKLNGATQSKKVIMDAFVNLFIRTTKKDYPIRRIGISLGGIVDEYYVSFDLFTDHEALGKEKRMQEAIIDIKNKYGKNSILKAMDLAPKATTKKRNMLIGGHNSGEEAR